MPELPDVESFKKYFQRTSLKKKIIDVEGESKVLVRKIAFQDFKKKLVGESFKKAWRRGKFLIVEIKGIPEKLVIHFGMTGDLHYVKQDNEKEGEDRFARLIFKFDNGYELRWLNMRKFGRVYLVRDLNKIGLIKEMGAEPLKISKAQFLELLNKNKEKNIKAFLMDQREIAGIGNVYSDEILFRSRINPQKDVKSLDKIEKEKLFDKMKEVLKEAIQIRPPTGMLFGANWLLAHRRGDMRCPIDRNHRLKKETIAGRSAVYCPIHQK